MTFRALVADIEAASVRLRADRDRASRQVDTLLDGGWSGSAAAAYADGWAEWCSGADQVLAGLEEMTRLLRAVEVSFVDTDRCAEAAGTRIATRLG